LAIEVSTQRCRTLQATGCLGDHTTAPYVTRHFSAKGKYADIVVLGMNPFEVPPETLKDIPIVETIFEGKTVFKLLVNY
jgi:hypothetical protein